MAEITSAGTESLLEKHKLQGNGTADSHLEKSSALTNGDDDALNDDDGEESDEYDVEEEQQAIEGEDDEYEVDEEEGGYEPEDAENGTSSLTALLLADPNSEVGNGHGDVDDDEDDEGDYEEEDDEEELDDGEDVDEPVSPSTSKKRSIDDLEEAVSSEAKKARA